MEKGTTPIFSAFGSPLWAALVDRVLTRLVAALCRLESLLSSAMEPVLSSTRASSIWFSPHFTTECAETATVPMPPNEPSAPRVVLTLEVASSVTCWVPMVTVRTTGARVAVAHIGVQPGLGGGGDGRLGGVGGQVGDSQGGGVKRVLQVVAARHAPRHVHADRHGGHKGEGGDDGEERGDGASARRWQTASETLEPDSATPFRTLTLALAQDAAGPRPHASQHKGYAGRVNEDANGQG